MLTIQIKIFFSRICRKIKKKAKCVEEDDDDNVDGTVINPIGLAGTKLKIFCNFSAKHSVKCVEEDDEDNVDDPVINPVGQVGTHITYTYLGTYSANIL